MWMSNRRQSLLCQLWDGTFRLAAQESFDVSNESAFTFRADGEPDFAQSALFQATLKA
jgi:hypothetical protein